MTDQTLDNKTDRLGEKECFTRLDKALGNIAKIKKRWNDRLAPERFSFENYLEGSFELVATFELFKINSKSVHVNSRHEVRPIRIRLKICSPKRDQFIAEHELQFINMEKRQRWNDQFVLIENVKIMESPNGVLPSVVGFQLLDNPECFGTGPLHCSSTGTYEFLPILTSRKIEVLTLGISAPEGGGDK
jgi:hypothetical protein